MKHLGLAMMAGGTLLLSACVSHEYGLIDPVQNRPYGYSEKPSGPNQMTVTTFGLDTLRAKSYWKQRVAELCPKGDAEENVYLADYAALPNMFGPVQSGATMQGTVSCPDIQNAASVLNPEQDNPDS